MPAVPADPGPDASIDALLERLKRGDKSAIDQLMPLVIGDLRNLARRQRSRVGGGETLRTTALIHEAYLKLRRSAGVAADSRRHFLHLAAMAMRQILVDHARSRIAARTRDEQTADAGDSPADLFRQAQRVIDVDRALGAMEHDNPRLVEIVTCRYFAGYSEAETGDLLGISERTVRRDWLKARALLAASLEHDGAAAGQ